MATRIGNLSIQISANGDRMVQEIRKDVKRANFELSKVSAGRNGPGRGGTVVAAGGGRNARGALGGASVGRSLAGRGAAARGLGAAAGLANLATRLPPLMAIAGAAAAAMTALAIKSAMALEKQREQAEVLGVSVQQLQLMRRDMTAIEALGSQEFISSNQQQVIQDATSSVKGLQGTFAGLGNTIATALAPIVRVVSDVGGPIIQLIGAQLKQSLALVTIALAPLLIGLKLLGKLIEFASGWMTRIGRIFDAFLQPLNLVFSVIDELSMLLGQELQAALNSVGVAIQSITRFIGEFARTVIGVFLSAAQALIGAFRDIVRTAARIVNSPLASLAPPLLLIRNTVNLNAMANSLDRIAQGIGRVRGNLNNLGRVNLQNLRSRAGRIAGLIDQRQGREIQLSSAARFRSAEDVRARQLAAFERQTQQAGQTPEQELVQIAREALQREREAAQQRERTIQILQRALRNGQLQLGNP